MRVLGVIEFVALSRQEQREVEFVLGDRLGTESLRRCLVGGSLRLLALTECDDPSDQRNDEEESDAHEQPRSRRFVRRWRCTACSLASRLAPRKSRSSSFSSSVCSVVQSSADVSRGPR